MLYITENEVTVALNLRNIVSICPGHGGTAITTIDGEEYLFKTKHTKILESLKYSSSTIEIDGDGK